MSNMVKCPYFSVPQFVIRDEIWAQLKPAAKDLYMALLHQIERFSRPEVTMTDADVKKLVGVSSRSLRNARTALKEKGLVEFKCGSGNKYRYVIAVEKPSKLLAASVAVDSDASRLSSGQLGSEMTPYGLPITF
jgi:hypothetical protein